MNAGTAPPAGTRDYLPDDVRRREFVLGRIKEAYERVGFAPLETPAIERVETLSGKYGDEGESLIFRILKRGEKLLAETEIDQRKLADLALRYDLTVPLARVVAANQGKLPKFFKRYQIQPVWRADRPQRGRFREFYQCDVDYCGTQSLVAELEVMQAVAGALSALAFDRFTLRVNDRRLLTGMMEAAGLPPEQHDLTIVGIDKLDKIGADGVRKELAQRGVTPAQIELLAPLLATADGGPNGNGTRLDAIATMVIGKSPTGEAGLATLRDLLELLGTVEGLAPRVLFDPSLARGLSYYTGPIFELAVEGLAGSMGGGGRYDGLIGMFSGKAVPAVGFSLGVERVLVVMEERGMLPALQAASDVMVLQLEARFLPQALAIAENLRHAGLRAEIHPEVSKLGNQIQYAVARGVACAVFVGDKEVGAGTAMVKDLRAGTQREVALAEVSAAVDAAMQR